MITTEVGVVANLLRHAAAPKVLLGVDVGTRKSGFAIAKEWAKPGQILGVHRITPPFKDAHSQFAAVCSRVIKSQHVKGVVVGWPLLPDGRESEECLFVLRFAEAVALLHPGVPLLLWDERSSSARARASLRSGTHRIGLAPEKRAMVDSQAALLLLNEAIEAVVRVEITATPRWLQRCLLICTEAPIGPELVIDVDKAWRLLLARVLGPEAAQGPLSPSSPLILGAVVDSGGEVVVLESGGAGSNGQAQQAQGQRRFGHAKAPSPDLARLLAMLPAVRASLAEHTAAAQEGLRGVQALAGPGQDGARRRKDRHRQSEEQGGQQSCSVQVTRLDGPSSIVLALECSRTTAVIALPRWWQGRPVLVPCGQALDPACRAMLPLHQAVARLAGSLGHIADLASLK